MSQVFKRCFICKEEMDGSKPLSQATCGDIFHLECIENHDLAPFCAECGSIMLFGEVPFDSVKEELKIKKQKSLKNSCDSENMVELSVKTNAQPELSNEITNKLKNRLNACETNIVNIKKFKCQQKINDLEQRMKLCEAKIIAHQNEKAQFELSNKNWSKLQNRLNDCEKKIESLKQTNAQKQKEKAEIELSNNELQKQLNEQEKKIESLRQSNAQLKINAKQSQELPKSQNDNEKTVEIIRQIIAQVEVATKNMNRLQNRMHECEKKFDNLKKVNTQLEIIAKQTYGFEKRLDKSEKTTENTTQLKTQLKVITQSAVGLQTRVHSLEKIMMELQQRANQSKESNAVSIEYMHMPGTTTAQKNQNDLEIENVLQELKMSIAQVSGNNTQKYDYAAEKLRDAIENAMGVKNQIIQDLQQQLKACTLALEQERQNFKSLTVKQDKLQKYLLATLMPDGTRDLVVEKQNMLMSSENAKEQKQILQDEPKIGRNNEPGVKSGEQNQILSHEPKIGKEDDNDDDDW